MLVPETGRWSSPVGLLDLALVAEEIAGWCAGPFLPCNCGVRGATAGEPSSSGVLPGRERRAGAAWCVPRTAAGRRRVQLQPPQGRRLLLAAPVEGGGGGPGRLAPRDGRTGDGLTQFCCPRQRRHHRDADEELDFVKRFAEVRFDGVQARRRRWSAGRRRRGDVERSCRRVVLQCAELCGAGPRVRVHVRVRLRPVLFGVPGVYRTEAPVADMNCGWRRVTHHQGAARPCSRGTGRGQAVSVASRTWATTPRDIQDCVQIHGGIGVTWDTTSTCTAAGDVDRPCTARPADRERIAT